mmetsp:Transcript_89945/g.259315  ORF Transcript_89945/g.259315 Transcript_89945/m.259315 type:complete len:300 (+) Transcript_89945:494-1393(+)
MTPIKAQLGKPKEVGLVRDLAVRHLLDDVATVDVDRDDRDNLIADILAKRRLHSLDQFLDAVVVDLLVLPHGGLAACLDLVEHLVGFLRPQNLCADQAQLRAVVFQPKFARLVGLPKIGGGPRPFQLLPQHEAEVLLQLRQIMLDCALDHHVLRPLDLLCVLGVVPASDLACVGGLGKIEFLDAVEHVAQVFVNLERAVAVGQNVQQGLVGDEVEAWKRLLLLLEVIIQRALATVNPVADVLQSFCALPGAADLHDQRGVRIARSVVHQLLERIVHLFETLRVVGQLRPNIVALHEDGL